MSSAAKPSITLIVAATHPALGIGLASTFPWPPLKGDLAYFARVTKRAPSSTPLNTRNAVIMGRKTWESIPERRRPLVGRVNVVVTSRGQIEGMTEDVKVVRSLEEGLQVLGSPLPAPAMLDKQNVEASAVGRIFVIGGAQLYNAALSHPATTHILFTKVNTMFKADTFFPLDLPTIAEKADGGWRRMHKKEMEEFTGEKGFGEVKTEGGIEFEFMGFVKRDGASSDSAS
jgi:dihydrofolate reductase